MLDITHRLTEINQGAGYSVGRLAQEELTILRSLVTSQFLQVIERVAPQYLDAYRASEIDNYHNVYQCEHFNHADVWEKKHRIFPAQFAKTTLELQTISDLFCQLGTVHISDEEKLLRPNIYWRLVRPGSSDVGPVHADRWFWDLGHGETPANCYRLKIWIALYTVSGASGLRVVPGSQKRNDWPYHGEIKGNKTKPVLDLSEEQLDLVNLSLNAGDFILFHDSLLHGGMPNRSDKSRVSLEFTLLIKKTP